MFALLPFASDGYCKALCFAARRFRNGFPTALTACGPRTTDYFARGANHTAEQTRVCSTLRIAFIFDVQLPLRVLPIVKMDLLNFNAIS